MDDGIFGPITVISSKISKFSSENGPSLLSKELISRHPNGRFFHFLFALSPSLDEGLNANKKFEIWLGESGEVSSSLKGASIEVKRTVSVPLLECPHQPQASFFSGSIRQSRAGVGPTACARDKKL